MKKFFIINTLMLPVLAVAGLLHAKEINKKPASLNKHEKAKTIQQKNSAVAVETIYSENFDNGASGWTFQDGWSEAFWHISETGGLSGKSYWCGIEELGGYDDNWQQTLTSPPINLAAATAPVLLFDHHFSLEPHGGSFPPGFDAWDAIAVRLSTDGTNFNVLPSITYNAASAYGFNARFGTGMAGWAGGSGGWLTEFFNLQEFAGETVWIQFLMGTDETLSHQNDASLFGWRIDNIRVVDGENTIFADDAGDTGNAQFVAGGPGGPILWHFTSDAAASAPTSAGCFEAATGNYQPAMKAIMFSPAIAIDDLPSGTEKLFVDFQLKGRLDPTPFPSLFAGVSVDLVGIEVRAYRDGAWQYWNLLSFALSVPGAFTSFNEAFPEDQLDVSEWIGMGDSLQIGIGILTRPDGTVVGPANLYVDDFSLTAITPTSVKEPPGSGIPNNYWLSDNFPNPFNPETEIRFAIPQTSHVVVKIFNLTGAEVRTLVDEQREAGYQRVRWDGKDQHGNPVASGVYLYQLRAGDPLTGSGQGFSQVRKMNLLR